MASKKNALAPAYLVVGSDELKSRQAVTRLKGHLDAGLAAFNLDERAAKADMVPADIVASLNTLPVGNGFRLVLVENAERLPKAVSEAIVAYLRDPNPACVLCLVASSLAKSTRLYKAVKSAGERTIVDCTPKKRWELAPTVGRMAARYGMRMDEEAARELVSRVGESTTLLDTQVKTLAALCRETGAITLSDVEAHVARTAEVKPWDFLDAVSAQDGRKALVLYTMMRKPSQVALLSLLTGRLRELICARALDERGEGSLLPSALGKQGWQVKRHLVWARGFAAGELERGLVLCARCDRSLKSASEPDLAFVRLVVQLCGYA